MEPVFVQGIGVFAPGLLGWEQARAVLRGETAYAPGECPKLAPRLLPPAVRRRCGEYIRLAVEVADEAVGHAGADASALASVFATAESDGKIVHTICEAVAQAEPMVSPTLFHNSVANAPAGYWCVAVNSRQPSTTVAGYDASVAVGLLESAAQLLTDTEMLLLVANDVPFPEPLHSVRPMGTSFGVAMVLSRRRDGRSLAGLRLETGTGEETAMDEPLESLRRGNPSARVLPLLGLLAREQQGAVRLPYLDGGMLKAMVEPCR